MINDIDKSSIDMVDWSCANCGCQQWMPKDFNESLRRSHNTFYCVNGHGNVYGGKIGIDNLPKKLKIFNFDDFVFAYSFNLCERYPCIAMGYYVFLIQSKRRMTMAEYKVSKYA